MRSHPLPPGPLADDLHALAARGGVRVRALRVLEASAKTSASNAFVAGYGPTRRIVLFDNLLGDEPDAEEQLAETRAVLAHELGHHASGDLWRMAAASAVATGICLAVVAAVLLRLPEALAHHVRRPLRAAARAVPVRRARPVRRRDRARLVQPSPRARRRCLRRGAGGRG